MKDRSPFYVLALLLFTSVVSSHAIEKSGSVNGSASIGHEVQRAVDRGVAWLEKNQNTNGFWSTEDQPAVTALAVLALKGETSGKYAKNDTPTLRNAYKYLESCIHEDGSIYKKKELLTHNTALSLLALAAAKDPKYDSAIRKGRAFLIGLQTDFGAKGKVDDVFDGGVGYGSHYDHSDMANTIAALEALHYTKNYDKDQKDAKDLNWSAAIQFLQNCQNLPSHNKQPWASSEQKNAGGFIYYPGHSMAGSETNAAGRVSFRSYGSTSYAGLLSYIYADLKPSDPRVEAVFNWLQRNYTLEENPRMGPQGLYYYYHTMSKALSAMNVSEIKTADGKLVPWRQELGLKLINLQKTDGSWVNDNGRWWEKDPALVTSYVVLSLEQIANGLK